GILVHAVVRVAAAKIEGQSPPDGPAVLQIDADVLAGVVRVDRGVEDFNAIGRGIEEVEPVVLGRPAVFLLPVRRDMKKIAAELDLVIAEATGLEPGGVGPKLPALFDVLLARSGRQARDHAGAAIARRDHAARFLLAVGARVIPEQAAEHRHHHVALEALPLALGHAVEASPGPAPGP